MISAHTFSPDENALRASVPAHEAICALQAAMAQLPQLELETEHHFIGGVYCRMLTQPAGSTVVGKVHRAEHLFIVCSGTMLLSDGTEPAREITGPCVLVAAPGTKRAIHALTPVTYLNVHRTDRTDLDEIEAELVEPDASALFDARNRPKGISWPG